LVRRLRGFTNPEQVGAMNQELKRTVRVVSGPKGTNKKQFVFSADWREFFNHASLSYGKKDNSCLSPILL
jgi:hypothetical protein